MMVADYEQVLHGLLDTNWNSGYVAKPLLYYLDNMATVDQRRTCVKVYQVATQESQPHGLGWTSKELETELAVDVKGPDRATVLKVLDEVVRILDSKRIGSSGYDLLYHDEGRKISGYAGFYHYVLTVRLKTLRKTI